MRPFLLLLGTVAALTCACNVDPQADPDGGVGVCEPDTAVDCVGDNNCKGGALCISGMGYGSCQCLDDAGALLLADGAIVYPHPTGVIDSGPFEVSMEDGGTDAVMFPDLGAPVVDATAGDASGTTCDNSEKSAPAPP
jgi:hypothetical protein